MREVAKRLGKDSEDLTDTDYLEITSLSLKNMDLLKRLPHLERFSTRNNKLCEINQSAVNKIVPSADELTDIILEGNEAWKQRNPGYRVDEEEI